MPEQSVDPSVEVWRSPTGPAAICMAGETASYRLRPTGEWVVGVITAGAMRATRAGGTFDFGPGDLCVWDASAGHAGSALGGRFWSARLMIVEPPAFAETADDPIARFFAGPVREPLLRDPLRAARFLSLHQGARHSDDDFSVESEALAWFIDLAAATGGTGPASGGRRTEDQALARACARIDDDLAAVPTLDELAKEAGVGKFRLVRLFKARLGVPPHRYQLGQRLKRVRRLLENGTTVASAAAAAGFFDQSHLHRHFVGATGITPARYRSVVRG